MTAVTMTTQQLATAVQCIDIAIKQMGVNAFADQADMRGTIAVLHNAFVAAQEADKKRAEAPPEAPVVNQEAA